MAQRQFAAKDRRLNHSEDPNNYAEACQEAIDLAEEDLSAYGDIYNRAYKSVSKRNTIAITKEDKRLFLKLVEIPKENQKDKKQIIEWTVKKISIFP